jgi:hypothetical protein
MKHFSSIIQQVSLRTVLLLIIFTGIGNYTYGQQFGPKINKGQAVTNTDLEASNEHRTYTIPGNIVVFNPFSPSAFVDQLSSQAESSRVVVDVAPVRENAASPVPAGSSDMKSKNYPVYGVIKTEELFFWDSSVKYWEVTSARFVKLMVRTGPLGK